MLSIPWKYICIYFLLRTYGPEITSDKFHNYSKLLSEEYCKDHNDKAECIVEQIKSFVSLANDTYNAIFANLTKYFEERDIKHLVEKFWGSKKDDISELYPHPSSKSKEKVNVSTAMLTMLDQMQQSFEKTHPGDSIEEVKRRLKTIATKYRNTKGFCTLKIGVDPLVVFNLINEVALMTNMPRHLQNILESAVKVIDAGSSMAKNEPFASNGLVHYILIAAFRNANNSLDFGLAVYHVEYKISSKGYQENADQETLKKLIRFLKTDTDDSEGELTWGGDDDLNAYFYSESYNMFMHECPALLTGFKKVRNDIKSSN